MRTLCLAAFLVLGFLVHSPSVKADARGDANRIVQILINQSIFNAMVDAMEPLTRQALAQTLSQGENARLSPASRDVITTMFLDAFRERFLGAMLYEYVQIYMAELTPDELAGLRAFLETPGQSFGAKQANLIRRGSVGRDMGIMAARTIGQRLTTEGQKLISNRSDLEILRRSFPNR